MCVLVPYARGTQHNAYLRNFYKGHNVSSCSFTKDTDKTHCGQQMGGVELLLWVKA